MKLADQSTLAGKIITACEKVQSDLKAFRNNLDAISGLQNEVNERRIDAIESAEFLYEELELLRWDAMECQADSDVRAGRVSGPFTSADDLMASLLH